MEFKTEPVTRVGESEPYRPLAVKDGKTAMHAALSIILNHTAEVFHGVVDAISDHYKISKDEMMDVILSHPAYTSITTNPVINDLGYMQPEPEAKPKSKKKFVIKNPPNAEAPAVAAVTEELGAMAIDEESKPQPQPQKKFQPKKVAAANP